MRPASRFALIAIVLAVTSTATCTLGYEYEMSGLPRYARETLQMTGEDQIMSLPWTLLGYCQGVAAIVCAVWAIVRLRG